MSSDKQTNEPNPSEPFTGLCKFFAWWRDFQRLHCQGIESTWSVNADYVVKFRFEKGPLVLKHSIDLLDPDIPQALFKMQIGLLKLQDAPNGKTNKSELTDERRQTND